MAPRKPARTGSTRQQQQQQQRSAARGAGGAPRSRSSGNGAAAGQSRVSANRAGANAAGPAAAVRKPAARGATASQPAPPAATGPLRRLVAPLRSMGWLPLTTLVLSLYGLGASIYLTIAHYDTSIRLACTDNGLVNCQAVTTSSESVVFGIFPVAVLGLAFFVFMVAVNSPWGWRLSRSQPVVRWGRLGSVIVGMGFVIYLIYAELIQINAICLWCTTVHVATFLIFVLVIFHTSLAGSGTSSSPRR
jgi:uncharacterized membrane protein